MSEYLFRRNTVLEALQGDRRRLRKLWLQEGLRMEKIFLRAAENRGVPVETVQQSPTDTDGRRQQSPGRAARSGSLSL